MKIHFNWKTVSALMLAFAILMGPVRWVLATDASAEEQLSSSEIRKQIDEMEARKAEVDKQIKELESQIQENLSEMEAIVTQKNIIDQEIFLLHQQVDTTNEMIAAYNVLISDKQAELNEAQERLDALNEKNKERIRAMEEEGSLSYWSVLFQANSFSDLLDRLNMIEEIAAADRRRLEEMREAAAVVAAAQAELQAEKVNLELVREELAVTEAELQAKRVEADELLAQLIAIGEEFEAYLEEGEKEQQQLLQEIHNAEEAFQEASASESYAAWLEESRIQASIEASIEASVAASKAAEEATRVTTAPTNYTKPTEGSSVTVSSSGWRSPLTHSSWVTSPYGMRLHPVYGVWKMHHGVDLKSSRGDEIVAARAGKVTVAKWSDSAGYYVKIDHGDGYSSAYLHMTRYIVSVGDYVQQGQLIGYVGDTGVGTGPHLHFSIYYNGNSVNPADYVNFS